MKIVLIIPTCYIKQTKHLFLLLQVADLKTTQRAGSQLVLIIIIIIIIIITIIIIIIPLHFKVVLTLTFLLFFKNENY